MTALNHLLAVSFKCILMIKNRPPQTVFWPFAKILIENPVYMYNLKDKLKLK